MRRITDKNLASSHQSAHHRAMSANPRLPVANMQNLMIQLGAAVASTVISGSALDADGSQQIVSRKASKRRKRL